MRYGGYRPVHWKLEWSGWKECFPCFLSGIDSRWILLLSPKRAGGAEIVVECTEKTKVFSYLSTELDTEPTIPFAFMGLEAMYKAGFQQPPAAKYRKVCESSMYAPLEQTDGEILDRIYTKYNTPMEDFQGRCLAASDVIELMTRNNGFISTASRMLYPCPFFSSFCKANAGEAGYEWVSFVNQKSKAWNGIL